MNMKAGHLATMRISVQLKIKDDDQEWYANTHTRWPVYLCLPTHDADSFMMKPLYTISI